MPARPRFVAIERTPQIADFARFNARVLAWRDMRPYAMEVLDGDMRLFLTSDLGRFDVVTAFCSLYYLPEADMARIIAKAAAMGATLVLQANEAIDNLPARAAILERLMVSNGYPYVRVHAPSGFARPLLVATAAAPRLRAATARLPRAPDVSSRVDPGIGGDDSVVIGGLPASPSGSPQPLRFSMPVSACLLAVERVPRVDVSGLRQGVERCRTVRCLTAVTPAAVHTLRSPSSTCGRPLLVACMKSSVCRALLFDVSSCCQRPSLNPYRATSATRVRQRLLHHSGAPGVQRLRAVRAVGACGKRRGPAGQRSNALSRSNL